MEIPASTSSESVTFCQLFSPAVQRCTASALSCVPRYCAPQLADSALGKVRRGEQSNCKAVVWAVVSVILFKPIVIPIRIVNRLQLGKIILFVHFRF